MKATSIHSATDHVQEKELLDLERVSKLPLSSADDWREEVDKTSFRIEDFYQGKAVDEVPEEND